MPDRSNWNVGDTINNLDILFGDETKKPHLWMILSDATADERVVVSNFTTHSPQSRPMTCGENCVIVQAEEHRYLSRESCIWQPPRLHPLREIARTVEQGFGERHDPLSPELLARIQLGILNSPDTPRAIKNAIRATLGHSAL